MSEEQHTSPDIWKGQRKKLLHAFVSGILVGVGFVTVVIAVAFLV